jgi:hypothetical protein
MLLSVFPKALKKKDKTYVARRLCEKKLRDQVWCSSDISNGHNPLPWFSLGLPRLKHTPQPGWPSNENINLGVAVPRLTLTTESQILGHASKGLWQLARLEKLKWQCPSRYVA